MKKTKRQNPEMERFTKALASVLSVSPDEMRDRLAQAKGEKPSPHKRWTYDPEADQT